MENVTPLWLTVAWRPADVKACLVQTAGFFAAAVLLEGAVSYATDRKRTGPFFALATFLTTGFTCMHHRTL